MDINDYKLWINNWEVHFKAYIKPARGLISGEHCRIWY